MTQNESVGLYLKTKQQQQQQKQSSQDVSTTPYCHLSYTKTKVSICWSTNRTATNDVLTNLTFDLLYLLKCFWSQQKERRDCEGH